MKNKIFHLSLLLPLLLSGCSLLDDFSVGPNDSSNSSTSESSKGSSSSEDKPSRPTTGTTTIEVYASNDIHGQIMPEGDRVGLLKYATYFNEMGKKDNTLLLDQGDTWQGSIYSNYNHGRLVNDVMNYIHYDARSVGNHDFDWGVEYLEQNTKSSYQGYSTPVLAGNVYDFNFDTKQIGNIQQSNIGRKSVTYILENGVKVGILGGIGSDQITSISSMFTTDIAFANHIDFIKQEAAHLRNDDVDLVLCGHTHQNESTNEGKLYYSQNYAYTESFGHITLTFDYSTNNVTNTQVATIYADQINSAVSQIDSGIQSIYNKYVNECAEAANEILANNVTNPFYYGSSNGYAEDLMATAVFDQASKEGYGDICLSYVNDARHALPGGTWRYSNLYEAFPFDNEVYIAEITGEEFMHEIRNWNYIYRNPNFTENSIDPNQKYKIAVLDYVYFHTDKYRYYDYFQTTGGSSTIKLSKNYRVILKDWLKENGYNNGKPLNPQDYSRSLWQHNRTVFY